MKCVVMSVKRIIPVGCGTPSTIIVEKCWRVRFGTRKDEFFLQLKALLELFGITRFYTDGWGAYSRHVEAEKHEVGKQNMQKIQSKHINLRARIKRLARKTICFSKTVFMHDERNWVIY